MSHYNLISHVLTKNVYEFHQMGNLFSWLWFKFQNILLVPVAYFKSISITVYTLFRLSEVIIARSTLFEIVVLFYILIYG